MRPMSACLISLREKLLDTERRRLEEPLERQEIPSLTSSSMGREEEETGGGVPPLALIASRPFNIVYVEIKISKRLCCSKSH